MKRKIMIGVIIILLTIGMKNQVKADIQITSGTEGSYNYKLYERNNGTWYIELTAYIGNDTNVIIPNTVAGYPVEKLYRTFEECRSLTSISIPEGVTSIEISAFRGCSSLTSINIPESVTSIGKYAFSGCSSLTSINIPSSVASIGEDAFYGCSSLTSINIPSSVTSIEDRVFSGCSSLTSINIPSSVTSIGWNAFSGCRSLTSINIPSSVTSIGDSAFYGCSSLTSINIPEGVTSIGGSTFYRCSSLTSINVPSSVKWIEMYAFYNCRSLTSINIPSSVTSIGDWAFYNCRSLTSINIPSSVTWLGDWAFYGWENNQTINFGCEKENPNWDQDWKYYCSAKIKYGIKNKITNIEVSGITPFYRKESQTVKVNILPGNADNKDMMYTSSDESIVRIDEQGVITPVNNGTASITVMSTDGSYVSKTYDIVVDFKVASMTINKTSLTFNNKETQSISATVGPEYAKNKNITWTSSNTKVATVDSNGKVTPVGNGSCVITCKTTDGSNISKTCNVTVDFKVTSVTLDKISLTFNNKETQSISATVGPEYAKNKNITWTSSNTKVATVDSNGKVSPIGNGSCVIICKTADGSEIEETCEVVVDFKVTNIRLNKTEILLESFETEKVEVTIEPEYAKNKSVVWTSSNEKIVKMNEGGIITPISNGTCEIICKTTDGSEIEVRCSVTVNIPYKKGDYDKNNTIDVTDAYLLLTAISKNIELADDLKGIVDMNEDGRMDVTDAYLLLVEIAKI